MTAKKSLRSYQINLKDEYTIIETIGSGSVGTVYLVEDKKDHQKYAAKVNKQGQPIDISREISILIRIQAPTIIKLHGFSKTDFNDFSNVTILMDYKDSSLNQYIDMERKGKLPPKYDNTAKQIILCGIAHGMMVLHSRGIIHRDLKPENVLLDSEFKPFITDFGVSKFLDPDNLQSQSQKYVGTAFYMSPEQLDGNNYGHKADVYAFGILMYEVIYGDWAFPELRSPKHDFFSVAAKILKIEKPDFSRPIKSHLKELIERCIHKEPKLRPTFRELFNKLSLSLAFDDDLIEAEMYEELSKPSEMDEEDGECDLRYCLPDVDPERLFEYVDEITSVVSTPNSEELITAVETQSKRIKKLEDCDQATEHKIQELEKKHQDDFESLRRSILEIQSKL